VPTLKPDEDELTQRIIDLASEYGRYGYRRVTALLNEAGIEVGKDRVQRIWRREGLKVPQKQPKRGRLWLTDGSCVRLRPRHRNHVWSFDFVECHTHDGRRLRLMTLIDEFTRKCLAIRVARRINAIGVIETLADAMLFEGTPQHIRSDNGPEMVAKVLRQWLSGLALLWLIVLSPLFFKDLLSAIWALLRRRPKDEIDDGVTYGGHGWLRRRPVDSFFSAPRMRGDDVAGRRRQSLS
jgi:transposase InsO family protein